MLAKCFFFHRFEADKVYFMVTECNKYTCRDRIANTNDFNELRPHSHFSLLFSPLTFSSLCECFFFSFFFIFVICFFFHLFSYFQQYFHVVLGFSSLKFVSVMYTSRKQSKRRIFFFFLHPHFIVVVMY